MDVVAEKTGYPADALDLSMSLEGTWELTPSNASRFSVRFKKRHQNFQKWTVHKWHSCKHLVRSLDSYRETTGILVKRRHPRWVSPRILNLQNPLVRRSITKRKSSESSEEESVSSEPETEMTDVVPQFETLWSAPAKQSVYRWAVSPKPRRRWDFYIRHWNLEPSHCSEMKT